MDGTCEECGSFSPKSISVDWSERGVLMSAEGHSMNPMRGVKLRFSVFGH
jgi:hypothetical protein